jgi:carnitine 3-dehydrogenase
MIGGGWAAHFLRNGMTVKVWDPAPDAEEKLKSRIAAVWPTLERLELHPDASPDHLLFAPTLVSVTKQVEQFFA